MKRLFGLFLCCFCFVGYGNVARADDIADVIVFQYGGKNYYYNDIDKLPAVFESIIKSNRCLQSIEGISVDFMFGALVSICRERRGLLDDLVNKKYSAESSVKPTFGHWGVDNMYDNRKSTINSLRACIVDVDRLANDLKGLQRAKINFRISADLDACISSIDIDPGVQSGEYCPLNVTVSDESVLSNLKSLNGEFYNKEFTFMDEFTSADKNSGGDTERLISSVLIYNGETLVACHGGKAVQMGRPVFSGFENCRGQENQFIPSYGELPDGVYLLNTNNIEAMNEEVWDFWGKNRVLLVPSNQSKTFGRNNIYLHGTEKVGKKRSGGCISMGTNIDEFVSTDWFKSQGYILVIAKSKL